MFSNIKKKIKIIVESHDRPHVMMLSLNRNKPQSSNIYDDEIDSIPFI